MYIPSINILRGLAALMVCLYHFTNYSDQHGSIFSKGHWIQQFGELGINGVFVFFVISGCVIPLSLHKYQFNFKKIGRFLWKRWIRIELPYLASIATVLLVGVAFALKENVGFVVEVERLFHHIFYSIPFTDHDWYNPIYWTLAIEFQFYILIAFVFLLLKDSDHLFQALILLLFAQLAIWFPDNRLVTHYAPIFALGILVAQHKLKAFSWPLFYGLMMVLFVMIVMTNSLEIAILSALTALAITYFKDGPRWGHQLGNMSYSLYLTHGVIGGNLMYLTARHIENGVLKVLLILGATLVSIVGAYFFWKWIEEPSQKLSQKVEL
jgi:peptidoglycan/LPS O-acetylase OafA/YrhL